MATKSHTHSQQVGAGDTQHQPSSTTSFSSPAAAPSADSIAIGAYLYARLNWLFASHPDLDELGLILHVTESMLQAASSSLGDALNPFHSLHPPPGAFLALQSENNDCPPCLVAEGSKLGLAFWVLPILIPFVTHKVERMRNRIRKERIGPVELARMAQVARENVSVGGASVTAGSPPSFPDELQCCTRILLLVNADNYTAWNLRKLLLSAPPLADQAVDSAPSTPSVRLLSESFELRFLNLVYSKHPKSGESWSHRRWVLSRMEGFHSKYHFGATLRNERGNGNGDAPNAASSPTSPTPPPSLYSSPIFQSELRMCERSADLYPKNYYAWMHRQWLVERIEKREELLKELSVVDGWTESHINDYSGFFHRQVIWNQIARTYHHQVQKTDADDDPGAGLHSSLPEQMRHWSKHFPNIARHTSSPSSSSPTRAGAAATVSPSATDVIATPAVPPLPSPSSTESSPLIPSLSMLPVSSSNCSFCRTLINHEWRHLSTLQSDYPAHETLWMHRRFVWIMTIMAAMQHQHHQQASDHDAHHATTSSIDFPPWLHALLSSEMNYAQHIIDDTNISNHDVEQRYAAIYKIWILHTALTITYKQYGNRRIGDDDDEHSTPFPLLSLLTADQRELYAQIVDDVRQFPYPLSVRHWEDRGRAATAPAALRC